MLNQDTCMVISVMHEFESTSIIYFVKCTQNSELRSDENGHICCLGVGSQIIEHRASQLWSSRQTFAL